MWGVLERGLAAVNHKTDNVCLRPRWDTVGSSHPAYQVFRRPSDPEHTGLRTYTHNETYEYRHAMNRTNKMGVGTKLTEQRDSLRADSPSQTQSPPYGRWSSTTTKCHSTPYSHVA